MVGIWKWRMMALGILAILAIAWQPAEGREKGAVTVIGEGRVMVQPDVARIYIGVVNEAQAVRSAMQENREIMTQVLAALDGLEIDEKDITTSYFSLHFPVRPERGRKPDSEKGQEPKIYRVDNKMQVTVRDLERIDAVLEGVTEAGANLVGGVQITVDDPQEIETQARKLAAEQGKQKALELAKLHGRKLGKAIDISEVIGGRVRRAALREMSGGGIIRPGETEISVRLQVTYELD